MRCNVGVNPLYLADQHLLAEMMEIPMVIGSLKHWNYQVKSSIPETFNLGSGHMNFLKNKLLYLQRRHLCVYDEIQRRGFKNNKSRVILESIPNQFLNDWNPTLQDSQKIRNRIHFKLINKHPSFWRYLGNRLTNDDMYKMIDNILHGELFRV